NKKSLKKNLEWKKKFQKQVLFNIFFSEAIATSGLKPCFFGTWESVIEYGKCQHPGVNPNSGYKSSCGSGKFQCNPTFFGEGICVDVDSQYSNLANSCFK
ncbi:hypothetical protein, partial [Bacteriovorax sp. DB6_IX]